MHKLYIPKSNLRMEMHCPWRPMGLWVSGSMASQRKTTTNGAVPLATTSISIETSFHVTESMQQWLDRNPQCRYEQVNTVQHGDGSCTPRHFIIHCPTEDDYVLAKVMFGEEDAPKRLYPEDFEAMRADLFTGRNMPSSPPPPKSK